MICSVELVLSFPAQVNICLLSTSTTCVKAQVGLKLVSRARIDEAIRNGCLYVWLGALRGNNDGVADLSLIFRLYFVSLYSSAFLFSIRRARGGTDGHLLVVAVEKGLSASSADPAISYLQAFLHSQIY